jgi:hypothetical protein
LIALSRSAYALAQQIEPEDIDAYYKLLKKVTEKVKQEKNDEEQTMTQKHENIRKQIQTILKEHFELAQLKRLVKLAEAEEKSEEEEAEDEAEDTVRKAPETDLDRMRVPRSKKDMKSLSKIRQISRAEAEKVRKSGLPASSAEEVYADMDDLAIDPTGETAPVPTPESELEYDPSDWAAIRKKTEELPWVQRDKLSFKKKKDQYTLDDLAAAQKARAARKAADEAEGIKDWSEIEAETGQTSALARKLVDDAMQRMKILMDEENVSPAEWDQIYEDSIVEFLPLYFEYAKGKGEKYSDDDLSDFDTLLTIPESKQFLNDVYLKKALNSAIRANAAKIDAEVKDLGFNSRVAQTVYNFASGRTGKELGLDKIIKKIAAKIAKETGMSVAEVGKDRNFQKLRAEYPRYEAMIKRIEGNLADEARNVWDGIKNKQAQFDKSMEKM